MKPLEGQLRLAVFQTKQNHQSQATLASNRKTNFRQTKSRKTMDGIDVTG